MSHEGAPKASSSPPRQGLPRITCPAVSLEKKKASWTDQPPRPLTPLHLQAVSARLCPGGGAGPPPPRKMYVSSLHPFNCSWTRTSTIIRTKRHLSLLPFRPLIKPAVIITTQIASTSTFPIKSLLSLRPTILRFISEECNSQLNLTPAHYSFYLNISPFFPDHTVLHCGWNRNLLSLFLFKTSACVQDFWNYVEGLLNGCHDDLVTPFPLSPKPSIGRRISRDVSYLEGFHLLLCVHISVLAIFERFLLSQCHINVTSLLWRFWGRSTCRVATEVHHWSLFIPIVIMGPFPRMIKGFLINSQLINKKMLGQRSVTQKSVSTLY